jgi:hypothetical protein
LNDFSKDAAKVSHLKVSADTVVDETKKVLAMFSDKRFDKHRASRAVILASSAKRRRHRARPIRGGVRDV